MNNAVSAGAAALPAAVVPDDVFPDVSVPDDPAPEAPASSSSVTGWNPKVGGFVGEIGTKDATGSAILESTHCSWISFLCCTR